MEFLHRYYRVLLSVNDEPWLVRTISVSTETRVQGFVMLFVSEIIDVL